jgi:hypothetical protein
MEQVYCYIPRKESGDWTIRCASMMTAVGLIVLFAI